MYIPSFPSLEVSMGVLPQGRNRKLMVFLTQRHKGCRKTSYDCVIFERYSDVSRQTLGYKTCCLFEQWIFDFWQSVEKRAGIVRPSVAVSVIVRNYERG